MTALAPETLTALTLSTLPDEDLTVDDVATCCYGEGSEILGDAEAAVAVNVRRWGEWAAAWILLLAVAPERQRRGRGRALVAESAAWARAQGAHELHLGSAIPRYVWPGVDFRFTAALSLFEAAGFEPSGVGFNMTIDTGFRAAPPSGVIVEREISSGAIELARRGYPEWEDEVTRGIARGGCYAARADDGTTIGFACHSVNRHALIGPMATDPERRSRGIGNALLATVCADIKSQYGLDETDISWVGPIGFYAKAGATVSRIFQNAKLKL